MQWKQVLGSSNVWAIAYDEEKKECYVKFLSGATYVYGNVGPGIWEELQHAQSKGRFISIHLRRAHPYRKVADEPTQQSHEAVERADAGRSGGKGNAPEALVEQGHEDLV